MPIRVHTGAPGQRSIARTVARAIACATAAGIIASASTGALAAPALPGTEAVPSLADFGAEAASPEARGVANWIVGSADNRGLPFLVIDKARVKVFAFHADGRLNGAAAVLLGLAIGDDSTPGIGDRPLSSIRPAERTTPAGRFQATLGDGVDGVEVLWVDYDLSVALHRVPMPHPKENRLHRLATPSTLDNRITFGCINVPDRFFIDVVRPAFLRSGGLVYVLPETRSASGLFGFIAAPAPPLDTSIPKAPAGLAP